MSGGWSAGFVPEADREPCDVCKGTGTFPMRPGLSDPRYALGCGPCGGRGYWRKRTANPMPRVTPRLAGKGQR